jgi:hypothetical protein
MVDAVPPTDCGVPPPGPAVIGGPPPFVTPLGGTKVVTERPGFGAGAEICTLYRADGTIFGRALENSSGQVNRVEWYDDQGRLVYSIDQTFPEGPGEAFQRLIWRGIAPLALGCSDGFAQTGWHIGTMQWRWNKNSFPTSLQTTTTETALREAHREWEDNLDWCAIPDNSTMDFTYLGTTTASASNNADLINTVDHGSMSGVGCSSSAVACELDRYDPGCCVILESDIRFSNAKQFVNGAVGNKYDIQSVAAHEVGHRADFQDVVNNNQVMDETVPFNNIDLRKLGQGDAKGNNIEY